MEFYAHTDPENPGKGPEDGRWHLLKDHLEQTAQLAEQFASAFGAGQWGYVAGSLHDLGKCSEEFQQRLLATADASIEQKMRVDHSSYGAQHLFQKWPKGEGKMLAYAIAGHHGGLLDGDTNEPSCLTKRMKKSLPYTFHDSRFLCDIEKPSLPFTLSQPRLSYEVSFLIRMLYSCLVDADFLDTEKHMSPDKSSFRPDDYKLEPLRAIFDRHLEGLAAKAEDSKINQIRSGILNDCLESANKKPGLFSLTVPTGGGKTLSSMAFALKHACLNKMKRIIYVIPYTSIIEQNAKVFRDILGDEAVLEHHSNYEPKEEDHRTRLASENWDAPIIVTTNVQFYESLYANKSSRCRKLHNIANSVVIFDEVQSLPDEYLLPCIEAIRELSMHYHCSLVLCSATQPAIQKRDDFEKYGLENVREIVSNPSELSNTMKRVTINNLEKQSDVAIAERLKNNEQALCIVNTKPDAKKLYDLLDGDKNAYHLSTLMCPAHRTRKFGEIRQRLADGLPCRVISTQLIEAGVDIDFPVVYRALAGIDSIAQAAGRCNREGRLERGQVYVFEPEDGLPKGRFRQTAGVAKEVIRRHSDLLALEAIEEYFMGYYWKQGQEQLDKKSILGSLKEGMKYLDFSFKEIAKEFKLIEENTKSVIIPFDEETKILIDELPSAYSFRDVSRKLQKYTVQLRPYYWDQLYQLGKLEIIHELFPVLTDMKFYDDNTGLDVNKLKDGDNPSDYIC